MKKSEYCDKRCMSVCLHAYTGTARPNITKCSKHATYGRSSILLWQRTTMSYFTISHNGHERSSDAKKAYTVAAILGGPGVKGPPLS